MLKEQVAVEEVYLLHGVLATKSRTYAPVPPRPTMADATRLELLRKRRNFCPARRPVFEILEHSWDLPLGCDGGERGSGPRRIESPCGNRRQGWRRTRPPLHSSRRRSPPAWAWLRRCGRPRRREPASFYRLIPDLLDFVSVLTTRVLAQKWATWSSGRVVTSPG